MRSNSCNLDASSLKAKYLRQRGDLVQSTWYGHNPRQPKFVPCDSTQILKGPQSIACELPSPVGISGTGTGTRGNGSSRCASESPCAGAAGGASDDDGSPDAGGKPCPAGSAGGGCIGGGKGGGGSGGLGGAGGALLTSSWSSSNNNISNSASKIQVGANRIAVAQVVLIVLNI